ncbi:MAG: hypothetical protein AAFN00_03285, partial [Cyanobacteria bacterium J06558_2]
TDDNWQGKLIDTEAYDWKGFSEKFDNFWDLELAQLYIDSRKILSKTTRGLGSQERSISIDLLTTGIVCGIWQDEDVAVERLKAYWKWFKSESRDTSGLGNLLSEFIRREEKNAKNAQCELSIPTSFLRTQVDNWVNSGYLFEKPRGKEVKELMLDQGMRMKKGQWVKG